MRAMILAAGRGSRMRHLTDDTPKPLLIVRGKPLIMWHLERLSAAGFKEVVINHAYLGFKIEAALGSGARWGLDIQYSAENTALETAGGIANALPLLQAGGFEYAPFLVVNGDVYSDINFENVQLKNDELAHLILVDNPEQHPEGDFSLVDGKLSDRSDKKLTFSGVGTYSPALFENVQLGAPAKLAPLLRRAISLNKVGGTHYKGLWHDIGTPERLAAINQHDK